MSKTENHYSSSQVKKGMLYFMSGKVLTGILGFLLVFLLVRMLSKQDYGIYIVLMAFLEIGQLGSSFGSLPIAFRYIPEYRAKNDVVSLKKLLSDMLVFRGVTLILVAIILYFLSNLISAILALPKLNDALCLYVFVIVFEGMARFVDVIFDSLLYQGYSQISVLLRNGLRFICLIMALMGVGFPITDIYSWILVEIFSSGIGVLFSLFVLQRKFRGASDGQSLLDYNRMFKYAFPSYLNQLVYLAQSPDMVKILVAKVSNIIEAGSFGFAAAISNMIQRNSPVFLLIGVVRPLFVAKKEQGKSNSDLLGLASLVFKLNLFFIVPIITIVITLNSQLAYFLSGGKFPEASLYLIVLLLLLPIQTFRLVIQLLAAVVESGKAGLYGSVFGLVGVLGGLIFANFYGPIALCFGLIVSELLGACFINWNLKRYYDLGFIFDVKSIFSMMFAGILAGGIMIFLLPFIYWSISILVIISSLVIGGVYLLSCFFWKPFTKEERNLINRLLPKPVFVW